MNDRIHFDKTDPDHPVVIELEYHERRKLTMAVKPEFRYVDGRGDILIPGVPVKFRLYQEDDGA